MAHLYEVFLSTFTVSERPRRFSKVNSKSCVGDMNWQLNSSTWLKNQCETLQKRRSFNFFVNSSVGGDGYSSENDGESKRDSSESSESKFPGDWRAFRARLVSLEKFESPSGQDSPDERSSSLQPVGRASTPGTKWAHPLPTLEDGCVLISTELLDGYAFFERSVVLLLNIGQEDAPWGLVLNKPHPHKVGKIKDMDSSLTKVFRPCKAFVGGPLENQRFILMHGVKGLEGFQEVVPGAFIGGATGIKSALAAVKKEAARPEDFCFYFGYAGWDTQQLKHEIELGWWHVAACSSDLVLGMNGSSLWEEVLTLMGDKYAELAQKKL